MKTLFLGVTQKRGQPSHTLSAVKMEELFIGAHERLEREETPGGLLAEKRGILF